MSEIETKLNLIREALTAHGLAAARLRGSDWFAWATGGGSNVVILTAETGVADVLVTPDGAWALTDTIEAERLAAEEISDELTVWSAPWQTPRAREAFVTERTGGGPVASDRPAPGERPLPPEIVAAKRRLLPAELERYRALGGEAAEAMTDVLLAARPDWTEWRLAGAGAEALWRRGIHPALTLVGGERRLPLYRHATATHEPIGDRAMLVFCGRRHGLYACLTRFVAFRQPTAAEQRRDEQVALVEAAALDASSPGARLGDVYTAIVAAYAGLGHPGAENYHHQGGTTGYLGRELVAVPGMQDAIEANTALAWNPSLPGAKIEDTFVTSADGLENLTLDPRWPTTTIAGRQRPALLNRA